MAMQYGIAISNCYVALNMEVGNEMNNIGSIGVVAVPLLGSFVLIGAVSSGMFENTDYLAEDAEKILNDVLEEMTTYLKIDDVIGKYYSTDGTRRVEKVVLLVEPLIQSTIDMSEMTVKISNNDDIIVLHYSGHAVEGGSRAVFEQQVWEKTNNAFSLIVILDKDRSLLDYNIMNEDTAFIAIRLPDGFAIRNGESITVSIIPAKGIIRSVVLETPSVHSSNIISFGEV